MSNRTFNNQQTLTLIKRVVQLFPTVSVGAAGAVTLQKRQYLATGSAASARSSLISAPTSGNNYVPGDAGIRSVLRNSAGDWTFTLQDAYQFLLGVELIQTTNAAGTLTSGFGVGVRTSGTNVQTNTATGNGGTIRLVLNNGSGTATDPASGDILTFQITLGDATEP